MTERTHLNLTANNYLISEERLHLLGEEDNRYIFQRFLKNALPLPRQEITPAILESSTRTNALGIHIMSCLQNLAVQDAKLQPLFFGITNGNLDQVIEYVSKNQLIKILRGAAVVYAAQLGHDDIVKELLGQGRVVHLGSGNIPQQYRGLAIKIAAQNQYFRTLNVLLRGHYSVFITDIEEIENLIFAKILAYNNEIDCRIFEKITTTFADAD